MDVNPKNLEVKARKLDFAQYKARSAVEEDCSILVDYDCLITENGIPRILYCKVNADTQNLRWAVKNIKYDESTRTNGLKTRSAIFGYSPRVTIRKDYCSVTAMARNFPKQHFVICNFAKQLTKLYEEFFPDTLKKHYETTKNKIRSDWTLADTPFTSGIVNKNNPLKYHHDAGNFKNVLSNMIVLKRGVIGGRLACPEYDIKFECDDNHVVIFDGAEILHGVTPIIKPEGDENCYRYSVVYYSLEQMWKCDGVNEEIKRIRKVKKEREHKRVSGSAGSDPKE
jgi:hypothetical protein